MLMKISAWAAESENSFGSLPEGGPKCFYNLARFIEGRGLLGCHKLFEADMHAQTASDV
jgi:hypothetical protein